LCYDYYNNYCYGLLNLDEDLIGPASIRQLADCLVCLSFCLRKYSIERCFEACRDDDYC